MAVDVGSDQRLAYSGQLTNEDGSRTAFCQILDIDGRVKSWFDTGNYLPTKISLAADGTIWSTGFEYPGGTEGRKVWQNYQTVRHYSPSGKILTQSIPNWDSSVAYVVLGHDPQDGGGVFFAYDARNSPAGIFRAPTWGQHADYLISPEAQGAVFLRTSGDAVTLYDSPNHTIYRSTPTGHDLREWRMDRSAPRTGLDGFSVLSDGRTYVSWFARDTRTASSGVAELTLGPDMVATWKTVLEADSALPAVPERFRIIGSDGNTLVCEEEPDHGARAEANPHGEEMPHEVAARDTWPHRVPRTEPFMR